MGYDKTDSAAKRILIVDDEPDFALMLGLNLSQMGPYDARHECDPARALAVARAFQPDLMLVDVMMPGLDGGDVVAELRGDRALRDVPVIFLTALVGPGEAPGAGLPPGQACLGKPVDFERLVTLIEERLAQAEQSTYAGV